MNNKSTSIFTSLGRALSRVLLFVVLMAPAIGPYTSVNASPLHSSGEAILNFGKVDGSTNWKSYSGSCILYNDEYSDGLELGVNTGGNITYDYPATVECTFAGSSQEIGWIVSAQHFDFYQLPVDSEFIYEGINWRSGVESYSGVGEPDNINNFALWAEVDNNGELISRSASLTFIANIGGGFEHNTCDKIFLVMAPLVIDAVILPQIEFPKGPTPTPPDEPDEQIIDLRYEQGPGELTQIYKLEIDGVWGDGTSTSMDEYEVSFDGVTWIDPADLETLCVDSTGWVFETDEDFLHVRVADYADQYSDNTPTEEPYPMFSVYVMSQIAPLKCSDKFTYDTNTGTVAAGFIQGNDNFGTIPEVYESAGGELKVGDWYMLETLHGPWINMDSEGEDTHSFDIAVDLIDYNILDQVEFSTWQYTDCWEYVDETETNKRYFFQAADTSINLFAYDPNFTFTNNADRIDFLLVHVDEYTYWPSGCEKRFMLGDQLFSTTIQAATATGILLEPVNANTFDPSYFRDPATESGAGTSMDQEFAQNQWYALETTLGPWVNEGVENRWDMDIRPGSDSQFYDFPDWPGAECVVPTDKIGHYRVYFQYPPGDADNMKYVMRVSDGNTPSAYLGNTGSMTVIARRATMAQVVEPGSLPTEGACDGTYSRGIYLAESAINPKSQTGIYAPGLLPERVYALETSGYWKDGAISDELTEAQISDDGGQTWYTWDQYPGALCFEVYTESNREYIRLYIRAETGSQYKIRAADGDVNYGNNTSYSYGLKVYEAQMLLDPFNTCADAYQLLNIPLNPMADLIPAIMETGITVPTVKGTTYGIEIYTGAWQETSAGADRYDAALSTDNGANFKPFSDRTIAGSQCYAKIGQYEWIYFIAGDSYTKVRVNGTDGQFADNDGALHYRLYAGRNVGDPEVPFDNINNYIPAEGSIGCYSSPVRPAPFELPAYQGVTLDEITDFGGLASLISDSLSHWGAVLNYTWNNALAYIGGSLSYNFTTAVNFFLWCPEHTNAIKGIVADTLNLEPLLTLRRLMAFQKMTKTQIESYDWVMDNAAEVPFSAEGGGFETDSLIPDMSASPFADGGSIEWTPIEGGGFETVTSCNAHMVLRWGTENPLVVGFCSVLNLAKLTNWNRILNIGIVLSAIVLFLRWLYKRFIMDIISLVGGGGFSK